MKVTFIGAGSIVFTRDLLGDLLTFSDDLNDYEVCLMDIDTSRLKLVEKMANKMIAQMGARIRVTATTDRKQALTNASYVIVTIQVGGLDAYQMDIEIPRKYGVEQCIGDTLGPGGVFRGLRHLAVISEIARELEELSPDATILQYTNPMAIICKGITDQSSIRTVGLCHSVQGTSELLARLIGAPMEEMKFEVAGINHVAWFLTLEWSGADAYPILREKMSDPATYGLEPVRFDLLKHFGYFVTESSGHASEYYAFFRRSPDVLRQTLNNFSSDGEDWFDFGKSGGYLRNCQTREREYYHVLEAEINGEAPIPIERSTEYGARIIHSIETNQPIRINGNVRNTGLITNLPDGACVEVPCLVDKTGIHPCYVGDLPVQLAALIRTNINVQELTAFGHRTGDLEAIRQAIKLDPLTAATCSLSQIDDMVSELFAAEEQWLPQFSK